MSGANALVVYPVVNQEGHKYSNKLYCICKSKFLINGVQKNIYITLMSFRHLSDSLKAMQKRTRECDGSVCAVEERPCPEQPVELCREYKICS